MAVIGYSGAFMAVEPQDPAPLPPSPYDLYTSLPSPRQHIPAQYTATTDRLCQSVMASWAAAEPSPQRKQQIRQLLKGLTDAVNGAVRGVDNPDGKRFKVDVFGSVAWGGETGKGGDLDLVIIDKLQPKGYAPQLWRVPLGGTIKRRNNGQLPDILPRVYNMNWLSKLLSRTPGITVNNVVRHASTPIIEFTSNRMQLKCDINCNDMGGWYNSSLILAYCRISPYVLRPMIHALKKWSSAHNLNDPSGKNGPASMSSYCLTLMAIGYLQSLGELPNLQARASMPYPCILDPTEDRHGRIWVSFGRAQGLIAQVDFDSEAPDGWTKRNPQLTAAQALRGFFAFFSRLQSTRSFAYSKKFVSVVNGGICDRTEPMGAAVQRRKEYRQSMDHLPAAEIKQCLDSYDERLRDEEKIMSTGIYGVQPATWGERLLVVQDPFIWTKNCAGGIHKDSLERWLKTVDATHRLLEQRPTCTLTHLSEPSVSNSKNKR